MMVILLFLTILLCSSVSAQTSSGLTNSEDEDMVLETNEALGVRYHTHVQNIGWETTWAKDGQTAGSQGQGLRLEGIEIELTGNVPAGATIEYRTHIQNIGWEDFWSFDGTPSGTEGLGLRLEGIQIQLVDLPGYSIEYRTHVQNVGWETTWAKDGEIAGSQGQGLRLEGIEIRLVKNNTEVVTDLTGQSDISAAGGSVDLSDGASVLVPAGALSENTTFDFSRMVEAGGTESFYELDGLPAYWMTPMEITVPLNESVANGADIYLAVYHDNSYRPSSDAMSLNRQLFKATVADGKATILLPNLNPDVVPILADEGNLQSEDIFLKYKIYISVAEEMIYQTAGWTTENFGRFRLRVPTSVANANPALMTEIKNALTESSAFIEDTAGVNLPYAGGRNPFPVEIFDFSTLIERALSNRAADAWGYLEIPGYSKYSRATALSNAWLAINSNKLKDANATQQVRATVAHELFHYYQQLYLPNDGASQGLLQEASAVWMEFQINKKYPDFWPKVIDAENVAWFPMKGLLRVSNTRCHNPDAHAYAASLFLQYMSDKKGTPAMGKLWQSVKTNDELYKAIADGFDDPNWYTSWPDFVKKLFSGDYTKAMPGTTWSIHNNAIYDTGKMYKVDDPYTETKYQFSSDVYALSAQSHLINLRYGTKDFNAGETADLKITNQNSADVIAYLYRQKTDGGAELIATIDTDTPYFLKDLAKQGKQSLSLVTATKWQPTAMGFNETKKCVLDVEIVFDNKAPVGYDCGWQPDYTNLIKKTYGANDLYKYGFSYYDSSGRRHGLSRSYYDAAQTQAHYATPFYEGKVHGIQTIWYDNGNMQERTEYQHGEKHGSWKEWWENGQLKYECSYANDQFNGDYKYWWKDGTQLAEGSYINGKKEGIWTFWYGNGNKSTVYTYVNDQWNGPSTTWYENGVKESEGNYVNGQRSGTWTWWNPDGTLKE
jgi:antitoxin component YwqK of YwqJK toxin-antitoxin module